MPVTLTLHLGQVGQSAADTIPVSATGIGDSNSVGRMEHILPLSALTAYAL